MLDRAKKLKLLDIPKVAQLFNSYNTTYATFAYIALTKLTVSMISSALNFHFYSDSNVPWNKRLLCRYRKFDVQVICPQPHMSFHLQHLSETCMRL